MGNGVRTLDWIGMLGSRVRQVYTALTAFLLLGVSVSAYAGSTTTTLIPISGTVVAGANVTLIATATGQKLTGTVTFKDGATTLGTSNFTTVAPRTARLDVTFSTVGAHSITATYNGDALNSASTSAAITVTVTAKATSTTLTTTPTSTAVGTNVALAASVTGFTPTGMVTFKDGTVALGTATLAGSGTTGTATFNATLSAVGSHSITAVYAGDANDATSTSTAKSVMATKAVSTNNLTTSLTSAAVGQSITLTAAIAGYSPTGVVTFKDGATTLGAGTISAGIATFNTTFNTVGPHDITAVYPGDANNDASTSSVKTIAVTLATSNATLTINPTTVEVAQSVTLTANITGFTPTGPVTFKDGAATLGTATLTSDGTIGTATFNTTLSTVGSHSITVVYAGDANNAGSTSAVTNVAVTTATTTTTLNAPPSAMVGASVTLTASVTGITPSGTVSFMDGATTLGTATLTSGTATLNTSFNTVGTRTITAVYSGDANNVTSTSGSYGILITPATPTVTIDVHPTSVEAGALVNVTVTVTGAAPTGNVSLSGASNVTGTGILVNGVASFTAIFNLVGPNSINAAYSGDTNNNAGNSTPVNVTVTIASTTTTLTVNPNPATAHQPVLLKATVTGSGANVSGTVTFKDGTATVGSGTVFLGVAEYNATFSTAGTHTITAVYSGDANNTTSTSAAVALAANVAPSTIVLTAPASAAVGESVILTATVSDFAPLGTVTFVDGTTELGAGTLSNGVATLDTTFSTAGSHSLTAVYSGDANNAGSTSAAVSIDIVASNQAPMVSLTGPTANANYTIPANIQLIANATDVDGTIAQVAFYEGNTLLGTTTSSPYVFDWSNVAIGSYTLTAIATDNLGLATTSAPVQITVIGSAVRIYYIHTDQLNTPRLITDATNTPVWRWDNTDPFANNPVNDDPNNTGNHFTFNQRFPGQYYDVETNTHYNYFRDYDPQTGRYIQSDPIGLEGGINTYAYVENDPLMFTDPKGLVAGVDDLVVGGGVLVVGCALSSGCRQGVSNAMSSAADAASKFVDKVKEMCTPDDGGPCEEQLKRDEAACAVPGIRYGKRGSAICMQSAMQRYSECLKNGPNGVTTPLHGVDTPL